MPTIEELKDNLEDIQGNVIRSYAAMFAQFRFYHIHNTNQGKTWLGNILKKKTGVLKHLRVTHSRSWTKEKRPPFTVNIAFTHAGLRALGLAEELLNGFPDEFKEGMLPRAVPILGDEPTESTDDNPPTPKNWEELYLQKCDTDKIHALVIITANSEEEKKEGVKCLEKVEKDVREVKLLSKLEGKRRPGDNKRKEHFGFTDGISQPYLEGSEEIFGGRPAYAGQGTPDSENKWRNLKPGEFILGYEDEFGEVAQMPANYDLRKNGTYLAFRKLEQDVEGFEAYCTKTAKELWPSDFPNRPDHYKNLVKAKFMGRWPSGCPMTLSPESDDEALAHDVKRNNNFLYTQPFSYTKNDGTKEHILDKDGTRCPLGSHIRRSNPRDHQMLAPKDIFDGTDSSQYHLNRHRIIRRGMTYGEEYTGASHDTKPRGIIFMAINSSISRQFEFIQQKWSNKDEHLGLDRTNRDPIIGQTHDGKAKFTVPGAENPFVDNLKTFVEEKGGEYFFYPGLSALQKLAADEGVPARPSFLSSLEAVEALSHPFKGAAAKQVLVREWLTNLAQEMFEELHASNKKEHKVFQVGPIPPPKDLPDLGKPPIVIATKYVDVIKILKEKGNEPFSVFLYTRKMDKPRGPFILGMEYQTAKYKKELNILKKAVYPTHDVGKKIYDTVDRLASQEMKKIAVRGRIDVIGDLVWPVALRLLGEFFGVPGPGPGSELDTLKRWCRDIYTDLFLNLRNDLEWTRRAEIAVDEMNEYLDELIHSKRKELDSGHPVPDTVLTRMIRIQQGPGDTFEDGWDGVRRNIFGTVIGVIETTLKAVPRTIDQLLGEHRQNEFVKTREAAHQYSYDQDPKHFKKYLFETMRFNPQNHVLFRWAIKDFTLGEGTYWKTEITASKERPVLVFAANLSAMFDPDVVKDPHKFNINRPDDHYLFFGYGPHECLGKYMSEIQIPLLIKHVLMLEGLKRAADDQFHPRDLRPEHFILEFKV